MPDMAENVTFGDRILFNLENLVAANNRAKSCPRVETLKLGFFYISYLCTLLDFSVSSRDIDDDIDTDNGNS